MTIATVTAAGPKVLIVSDQFPPAKGGIGDYTALLSDALVDCDVRVSLFVREGSNPKACRAPIAATFHRWSWAALSQLHRTLVATNADWIHLQHNGGLYGSCPLAGYFLPRYLRWKRWPGKIAVTFHDLNRGYLFPWAGRLRDWVLADLAKSADLVFAADSVDVAELSSLTSTVRQVPIGSNIPTSADEAANRTRVRANYGIPQNCFLVGHFATAAGLDTLLDAIATLPNAVLILIGKTQDRGSPGAINIVPDWMHEQIDRLGLGARVRWTSHLPVNEVARVLSSCDVLALPYPHGASLRHGGLLACIAQARPVITTDPPKPIPGLTPGAAILTTKPRDAIALANAIQQVLSNEALRNKLTVGASLARRVFSWVRIAEYHGSAYRHGAACPLFNFTGGSGENLAG